MINLPKRDDPIYKEIESFEDYELTNNVAYEMMVRNNDFATIIKYSLDEDKTGELLYDNLEKFGITYKYPLYLEYPFFSDLHKSLINIINKNILEKDTTYQRYHWFEAFGANSYMKVKQEAGYQCFLTNEIAETKKYKLLDKSMDMENLNEEDKKISLEIYTKVSNKLKKSLWYSEEEIVSITGLQMYLIRPFHLFDTTIEHTKLEAFKLNKFNDNFSDNVIIQTPNRPRIRYKKYTFDTKVVLNMALPKEELLKYIEHIKDDFDNDKNTIENPLEILGESLQKADDISKMCTVNKNGKELCFDGRKGITRTQKLADMFFIYDMVKKGYGDARIRAEISEYYEVEYNRHTETSDTTFRKYRDIAKDYIDNERYKELITGVKS